MPAGMSAAGDLGLGANLVDQLQDETEDEKRRRKLGMSQSSAAQSLFGYGQTGLAAAQLGLASGGRY